MGIIGGSGLDDPEILEDRREIYRETPYGEFSMEFQIKCSIQPFPHPFSSK